MSLMHLANGMGSIVTANEMRVVEGIIGGTYFSLRNEEDAKQSTAGGQTIDEGGEEDRNGCNGFNAAECRDIKALSQLLERNERLRDILAESIAINSTAFQEHKEDKQEELELSKESERKSGAMREAEQ